ncbi:MAG: DUF2662 domain-containing protein [Chloroflexi bacterium]|nr:MAG: DUF2662 domain-containing protein [Chloroflexota bacterium]
MKGSPLSKFEAIAQRLIEGSFNRLFGGRLDLHEVAVQVARVLDEMQSAKDDQQVTGLIVHLNPDDYETVLQSDEDPAATLKAYVVQLARQDGRVLPKELEVVVKEDTAVSAGGIQVHPRLSSPQDEPTTQIIQHEAIHEEVFAALRARDAYLIVDGKRHISLNQPLVTLGRRVDNDIVLDSPTVSRLHAQIRWRYGRFVLYDVSNRGRTFVNGEPVTEYVLHPGDVIALSDTLLIYGEGNTGPHKPQANRPPANDEDDSTMILPRST